MSVLVALASSVGSASAVADAPPPSPTEDAAEGAGYGGSSDWLLVAVEGGSVQVRGGGFRAGSDVEIEIGDRISKVRADELGNVEAWLEVSGDDLIVARGVAADDSERVVMPAISTDSAGSSLRTTGSLALGAAGAWVLLRNSQPPVIGRSNGPGLPPVGR